MLKTKIIAFTILYHYQCCFSETWPLIHLAQSDYAFRFRAFRASTLHSSVRNTKISETWPSPSLPPSLALTTFLFRKLQINPFRITCSLYASLYSISLTFLSSFPGFTFMLGFFKFLLDAPLYALSLGHFIHFAGF